MSFLKEIFRPELREDLMMFSCTLFDEEGSQVNLVLAPKLEFLPAEAISIKDIIEHPGFLKNAKNLKLIACNVSIPGLEAFKLSYFRGDVEHWGWISAQFIKTQE